MSLQLFTQGDMEIRNILVVLLLVLGIAFGNVCQGRNLSQQFDWNGATAVDSKKMSELTCNKDTQIDFNFPQAATGNLAVTAISTSGHLQYEFNNTGGSTLQFLNRDGVNQSFTLNQITLVKYSTGAATPTINAPLLPDFQLSVTYLNSQNEALVVSFYLLLSTTTIPSESRNVFRSSATSSFPGLQSFYSLIKNLQGVASTLEGISSLSIFNQPELSNFYTQMSSSDCKVSFLRNRIIFQLPSLADPAVASFTTSPYPASPASNQPATGNLLCFGSMTNTGIFQTHMRDNFAHWAAWWSVLIFWISMLFGEATTQNVFDNRFNENRWTNWGMYSLFYLAHEQFFTRMMRTVPMYICFCWQGCVAAILYCHLGPSMPEPTTIIIFGAISWAASLPLQWMFGAFTKSHYNNSLELLIDRKKLKNLKNKQGQEAEVIEERMEILQKSLYASYYWLYIFAFSGFVAFWTLAINRLQQLPRQFYYQQSYWLAALGVAWAFDNFVFDPLFSLILGGTSFYRFRPYYYDSRLGESFKELEN